MQLAVSFDNNGKILMMFNPAQMRIGKGEIGYSPAPGENHQVLDVPRELEGKSIEELAKVLTVNVRGTQPALEAKR
jgi:hypothetical protein